MKITMRIFIFLYLFSIAILGQYPIRSTSLSVDSILRVAPNEITYSIYFTNTALDSAISYSGGQFHLNFNKAILNGGVGTLAMISSELPVNLRPVNPTVDIINDLLKLAPNTPPGALAGGFLVQPGDSILIVKMKLSTSAPSFASGIPNNISWRIAPSANPVTKTSAYIWNSNQIITSGCNFFVYPISNKELNITSLIEGFYNTNPGPGYSMVGDTISIELRNASSPFGLVDQTKVKLNSSGNAIANFFSAAEATNYYLVIKHRNALESWSGTPQQFANGTLSYDFTSSVAQTYGNNAIQIPPVTGKWCIYGGDMTSSTPGVKDGIVDGSDLAAVDNDNTNFVTGYVITDLTGEQLVDGSDLALVDNNNTAFIGKIVPPGVITVKKPNKLSNGDQLRD